MKSDLEKRFVNITLLRSCTHREVIAIMGGNELQSNTDGNQLPHEGSSSEDDKGNMF